MRLNAHREPAVRHSPGKVHCQFGPRSGSALESWTKGFVRRAETLGMVSEELIDFTSGRSISRDARLQMRSGHSATSRSI